MRCRRQFVGCAARQDRPRLCLDGGTDLFHLDCQGAGFFAKYGIDPELILMSRGPVLIAGLTSGDVHVGNTGGTAALNAAVGGIDLKLVATFNSRWVNNVVARSGIQTPKDLAKKRFGVSSLGGPNGWEPCSGSNIWDWTHRRTIFVFW